MNEMVNQFLLTGDKFMPEMHLKHPGFTHSACEPFTKNKKRIQKFKETGDTNYIYKNDLGRPCFQHGLLLWFTNFWIKIIQAVVLTCMQIIELNKISVDFERWASDLATHQLAEELHKPIIKKILKRTVY